LVYEGGSSSSSKTKIIHGQSAGNFHIDDQVSDKNGMIGYLVDAPT
jgi:hypothetical protein